LIDFELKRWRDGDAAGVEMRGAGVGSDGVGAGSLLAAHSGSTGGDVGVRGT
jgi:hypothetical protein